MITLTRPARIPQNRLGYGFLAHYRESFFYDVRKVSLEHDKVFVIMEGHAKTSTWG